MKKLLIGRFAELEKLELLTKSVKSEFVAVYGRRRVGKTFLIRQAFRDQFTFQFTGIANVNMSIQLAQFHAALLRQSNSMTWSPELPSDWFKALEQLIEYIELIDQSAKSPKRKVIFLDELPWMDTQNSRFRSALEHFWNSWASARTDILLIGCGSAAAWMTKHLIKSTGGLHNRITEHIKLMPFSLSETELLLKENGIVEDRYQTLLFYMVFGGIPFYLEKIVAGKSAMQNINQLCFQENAPFQLEYDILYASLFNKHERHVSIVEALATKNKGLSRKEITQKTQLTDGGGLSRILNDLEQSNFIRKYKIFGKKEYVYQLIDQYSLFYLRFIKHVDKTDDLFWTNKIDTPAFYAWAGNAFEKACLLHIPQIKAALGISGIQTTVSTWQADDAQIDLVIDRKDHVINICEIKFSMHKFSIDKKYADVLSRKLSSFKEKTKTKKALFLTMITSYGAANKNYWGMVQNHLQMNDLFA